MPRAPCPEVPQALRRVLRHDRTSCERGEICRDAQRRRRRPAPALGRMGAQVRGEVVQLVLEHAVHLVRLALA